MTKVMSRFKENFAATRKDEQGDIVQTLLIIAIFVVIVVVVGGILTRAINNKAKNVETCLKGTGAGAGNSGNLNGACN